ncbi:MAG: HEAT repeat domain-containing protein [Proteobacteria bacterium]|nr:HEAT repeat domain-containing protein [Pseudomonadota bacterium]
MRWAIAGALLLLAAAPANAADAPFDLAAWAMSLDPDRPATGEWVLYEGGPALETDVAGTLRTSLYAEDPLLPLVAVGELAAYGVPAGEEMLLEIARSEQWAGLDEDLQAEVVTALRTMRSGRALPVLGRIALSGDSDAAREAIRALCESSAPEAEPVLKAILAQGDRKAQKAVIRWLRKAGERDRAKDARQFRRADRREDRSERREDRREDREDRREDRKERRDERKDKD